MEQDFTDAAVRAIPGSVGVVVCGLTLNEWVAVVTILYFVLQIGLLSMRYYDRWKNKRGQE